MIRRAQSKDIKKVLELLVQVDMVHHNVRPDLFKGPATKYTGEELERIFADDLTPVFVYTDEADEVLGYAFCIVIQHVDDNILTDIRTLYIDDICIDEACRGRHIGTAIYEFVRDWAKEQGFYNITLNVWEGNEAAKCFYTRMGMKPYRYSMETLL